MNRCVVVSVGRFATREHEGVLFYNGRYNERHDFVSLELIDGHIEFSFSLGIDITRVAAFPPPGVQLNDGHWHQVTVNYLNRVSQLPLLLLIFTYSSVFENVYFTGFFRFKKCVFTIF